MKLSEEYCEGWCNESGGKGEFNDCTGCQIHKLEAQVNELKGQLCLAKSYMSKLALRRFFKAAIKGDK